MSIAEFTRKNGFFNTGGTNMPVIFGSERVEIRVESSASAALCTSHIPDDSRTTAGEGASWFCSTRINVIEDLT